jgi:protein TonB
MFARPSPQNPLSAPQDWSMNAAPSSRAPTRSSRGFDTSVPGLGGETDSVMSYIAGAHPSGDWIGALKRWVQSHTYYPEAALDQQQQGAVTVVFEVDRSGRVLSSSLARSSRSPFLDMGFLGEFRNATVPSFTPDMKDPTTTVAFTMNYVLVNRSR